MKKKAIAVSFLFVALAGLLLLSGCQRHAGASVERGEWLAMLAESFQLDSSKTQEPYYQDVSAQDPLFMSVQALGDWKILAPFPGDRLDVTKTVTRQEVAASAAIAAGFKVREDFTIEQAAAYAETYGILDLTGDGITKEECEAALEAAQNVYLENPGEEKMVAVFNPELVDLTTLPFGAIQTQEDGVVIIPASMTGGVYQDADGQEYVLVYTPQGETTIRAGSTFMTPSTATAPQGLARKAVSFSGREDASVAIQTRLPDIGDIYDDLEVHTTVSLDQGEIAWSDGVSVTPVMEGNGLSAGQQTYHVELLAKRDDAQQNLPKNISLGKTYSFSMGTLPLKTAKKTPDFIKDVQAASLLGDGGYEYFDVPGLHHFDGDQKKWERALKKRTNYTANFIVSGEITLDVNAVTDVEYHKLNIFGHEIQTWPESATLVVNSNVTSSLKMEGVLRGEYELGKISIPIGTTGLYVTGSLFLYVDINGAIELTIKVADQRRGDWSISGDSGEYRSDNAAKRGVTVQVDAPTIDLGFGAGVSVNLCVLSDIRLIGAKATVGCEMESTASAVGECQESLADGITTKTYSESVRFKADLYAPVASVTISGPEHFSDILGLSKTFTIWDKENAPIQKNLWDKTFQIWSKTVMEDADGNVISEALAPFSGNTYMTHWSREYGGRETPLAFTYPEGWSVTGEECGSDYEQVTLTNERGAEIVYQYMSHSYADTGPSLHFSQESDISQVAEVSIDGAEPMMVAKVTPKRSRYANLYSGPDWEETVTDLSGDHFFYAVLPSSQTGLAWRGTYGDDSFEYYSGYVQFTAQGEELTEQETQEVIQILSSLRADDSMQSAEIMADPTLAALKRGDFSEFAGRYTATDPQRVENYGGIALDLILKEDGSTAGGGMVDEYGQMEVLNSAPIDVQEGTAGSFDCVLWEDSSGMYYSTGTYFTIYPPGVPSGMENEDTSKARIYYVYFDGGVWDMYYTKVD